MDRCENMKKTPLNMGSYTTPDRHMKDRTAKSGRKRKVIDLVIPVLMLIVSLYLYALYRGILEGENI